ncbi:MAG: DUF4747 family protein [Arenimonas sp.]|jgi:hypothetical protein
MPLEQVIQQSAINIVLHPHPAGAYESLIKKSRRLRIVGRVFGDRWGVFSQVYPVSSDGATGLHGVISTFIKIDNELPWFNTATHDDASDEDLQELLIPENLQPNHRKCNFYLDSNTHTLVFDSLTRKGGITANQMLKFLTNVFNDFRLHTEFGSVNLTIVNDEDSIKQILNWSSITSLFIHASRPNVGDYDARDLREFDEYLQEQGARVLEQRLVAEGNEVISPNEKTKKLAQIASDNGYVTAKGRDPEGRAVEMSTKDGSPLVETGSFDAEGETYWDAFFRIARNTIAAATARRRRGPR